MQQTIAVHNYRSNSKWSKGQHNNKYTRWYNNKSIYYNARQVYRRSVSV
jgi:hypothetical protein